MPHATTHRVLFVDAYDSFTNNIIAFLETHLDVEVTIIKIDEPISDFPEFLKPFSAVVAGAGPGDPRKPKDVGWIRELWKLEEKDLLPVLGICLGFQSLVLAFGGTIDRLGEPRHGVVRKVTGSAEGIFAGLEEVETVQYHSLYASIELERENKGAETCDMKFQSLKRSDLRPLAWDYDMNDAESSTQEVTSSNPQRVLMAVEHRLKPFFGVQFHAESICSSSNAGKVIEAWWETAKKWRRPCRDIESLPSLPRSFDLDLGVVQTGPMVDKPILEYRRADDSTTSPISVREIRKGSMQAQSFDDSLKGCHDGYSFQDHGKSCKVRVDTQVIELADITLPSICETLGLKEEEVIILDSEMHQRHDVGEHSIIGITSAASVLFEYEVGTNVVRQVCDRQSKTIDLLPFGGSILSFLKTFMNQYNVDSSNKEVPFWGGLMGFISYEACLETIGITDPPDRTSQRPDLSFIFIERSIVIDHLHQKVYVQTIKQDDHVWVDETALRLENTKSSSLLSTISIPLPFQAQMSLPDASSYQSKIRACQSAIRAGDSYELCLTTQATIHTQNHLFPWSLYLRLRNLNSAPFSAYVRLGNLTVLSSSPERFLQWSRPTRSSVPDANSTFDCAQKTIRCQFRPIKGTVKRQPDPNHSPLTLAEATALLATPKERAENLMIVDLIRHDLHGVVGSGRVSVPKLMVVEEYATLFQLVSVIEGSLIVKDDDIPIIGQKPIALTTMYPPNRATAATTTTTANTNPSKTGIDILAASLPPGSMTGAPKLRSCQILQSLEGRPRGVYSGVIGYLDVGGGGDFSVVIRSAVRWDPGARRQPLHKTDGCTTDKNGAGHAPGPADDGDDDDSNEAASPSRSRSGDTWTIGAGGAVTSLSTEEGEWDEMTAKLRSTLRLFDSSS